jgi:hypothetical protein
MFAEGRQHGLPGSKYLLEQIGDENIRPLQRIECITEKKDVEQRIVALSSSCFVANSLIRPFGAPSPGGRRNQ